MICFAMGLDIYFEQRKRNEDRSDVLRLKDEREKLRKEIDNIVLNDLKKRLDNQVSDDFDNAVEKKIMPLEQEIDRIGKEIDEIEPRELLAHFSKVNFLLRFFKCFGNCEYQEITKENVMDLISKCKEVLGNHKLAKRLLPTVNGGGFGNTKYNNYYFDDVNEVLAEFEKLLRETDWENNVVEMYAWY